MALEPNHYSHKHIIILNHFWMLVTGIRSRHLFINC